MTIFHACDATGLAGQGQDRAALDPAWLETDPRVADLGSTDQVVQRHPVGLRQWQQQLQARAALPVLQPRQRALGDARSARRASVSVISRCGPQLAQPRTAPGPGPRDGVRRVPLTALHSSGVSQEQQHSLSRTRTVGAPWGHEQLRRRGHRWRRSRPVRRAGPVPGPPQGPGPRCRTPPQRTRRPHARLPLPRRAAAHRAAGRRRARRSAGYGGRVVTANVDGDHGLPPGRVPGPVQWRPPGHHATGPGHHRAARRAARHPRPDRTLGSRRPALPVLPRLRGPRPAARRPRMDPRSGPIRPDRAAVEPTTSSSSPRRHPDRDRRAPSSRRAPSASSRAPCPASSSRTTACAVSSSTTAASSHARRCSYRRGSCRNNDLLVALGAEVDEHGWVRTDASGRTSVPGLWVAGNVANPRAQVITAAGEGSAAAIAINADLVDDDVTSRSPRLPPPASTESVRRTPRSRTNHHDKLNPPGETMSTPPAIPARTPVGPPTKHQLAADDLAGRLPDSDHHQPAPRRLAQGPLAGRAHLRAGHHRGPDRDLRRDASASPSARAVLDEVHQRTLNLTPREHARRRRRPGSPVGPRAPGGPSPRLPVRLRLP